MSIDDLTEMVIGYAITVHTALGPGLLESIYRDCLVLELVANELLVEVERRVPVIYREVRLRDDLRLDLLIDEKVVVEVKAVDRLHPIHQAQLVTYLKLSGFPAGLLINFNAMSVRAGMRRCDHPEIYAAKKQAKIDAARARARK